ncbi:hypothetical protein PMIN01_03970 [Paraphaeosphaeria minitans]|uniref:Uncharacterized protein n=1 Tax=Paraphaeosphaeria minitans TaxID=565426 RepID=A0A9P6GN18_9PLEO|nr:hypothetical protein PMIN01_03970 [Paraphaeosphaeria minitans]
MEQSFFRNNGVAMLAPGNGGVMRRHVGNRVMPDTLAGATLACELANLIDQDFDAVCQPERVGKVPRGADPMTVAPAHRFEASIRSRVVLADARGVAKRRMGGNRPRGARGAEKEEDGEDAEAIGATRRHKETAEGRNEREERKVVERGRRRSRMGVSARMGKSAGRAQDRDCGG